MKSSAFSPSPAGKKFYLHDHTGTYSNCKSYFKRKAEKLKFHLIAIGIAINLRDSQNVSEQLALKVKSKCTLRDRLRVVPHFSSEILFYYP